MKLLLVLGLLPLTTSKLVELHWNISYVPNVNPDGLHPRRAIGVNGIWPPPPVFVEQHDTLKIHVYNGLGHGGVGTAIHTHGLFFNGTGFYDGAVGVTQCPIPPGETLTYEIPTDRQWGTYWIHGHYLGQYVDGLRTPLIIRPRQKSTYEYDEEYTIVLSDWYHEEHPVLLKEFINPENPDGNEPVPNAPLLYVFKGHDFYPDQLSAIANGSATNENAAMRFEKGSKYRIRVINMSALAMFWFGIGGHSMNIIELDSTDTKPHAASMVPLSIGQRVSVLVTARDDTDAEAFDWPIMANMDPDMFDEVPDDLQMNITARLTYSKSAQPLILATIFDPEYPKFDELALVPLHEEPLLPADVQHVMDGYLNLYSDGTNRGSFGNITYQAPLVPSIITALTMSPNASRLTSSYSGTAFSPIYGAQTHAVVLNHLDVVEIVIRNFDDGPHPFHIHGHVFQVVQISDTFDPVAVDEKQVNPIRRDVVQVPAEGSVRIRFVADNPGVWIFHCHVEWHLESGLASVFVEAPEQIQSQLSIPRKMLDQCARQGIPTSGNVVGRNSTTDFTGQPFGPFPALEEAGAINGIIASLSYRRWIQLAAVGLAMVLVCGALVRKKIKKNAEMTASLDSKYDSQLTYGQRVHAELTEPLVKAPEQQSA